MANLEYVGDLPPIRQFTTPAEQVEYENMRRTLRANAGAWFIVERSVSSHMAAKHKKNLGTGFEASARMTGYNTEGKRVFDIYARRLPLSTPSNRK